ncbi:hypothetical protein NUW54_g1570 [Trametes sanguinea]|uniref:Uncharacterized protein n=1 Tax=Trametes sanguinea TaxID=158606 RepID=A0ACC1Q674_9APHY|nr:hypothetical protein NUW54_g1570 [Trametes sanguinea]
MQQKRNPAVSFTLSSLVLASSPFEMPHLKRDPYPSESEHLLHSRESFELEARDDIGQIARIRADKPEWAKASPNGQTIVSWMVVLLVVVAATDLAALFYMSRIMSEVYADVGTAGLEYANPYHGLAELYSSGAVEPPRIAPLLNTPRVVAQVFSDQPAQLAPIGEHDLFNKAFGTFSPHEKHLYVAENTITIAQFRTVDFGMEECSLVFRLPGSGDRIESKEPFQFNPLSVFDVYRLDAPAPLDIRKLSYHTRPPVQEKVATVSPRPGEETFVSRFPCPWSTLHTFEVVCSKGSDCLVDVWSSQNTTWGELLSPLCCACRVLIELPCPPGFYMYQHQTI